MADEKTKPEPDSEPKITNTQKEKDPRKVEAGRKLGTVSKMAKNQKKYKAEAHEAAAQSFADNNNPDYSTAFYAVFAVVVAGCLGALYRNSIAEASRKQQPKPQEAPNAPGPKFCTSVTHSNLISLDD